MVWSSLHVCLSRCEVWLTRAGDTSMDHVSGYFLSWSPTLYTCRLPSRLPNLLQSDLFSEVSPSGSHSKAKVGVRVLFLTRSQRHLRLHLCPYCTCACVRACVRECIPCTYNMCIIYAHMYTYSVCTHVCRVECACVHVCMCMCVCVCLWHCCITAADDTQCPPT